mmetsp:Transcript_10074/g.16988  ORF Transcript_10074/g.16988 Transcript_10074/m.16988 type:complete len:96 (+) Transcript_10074:56-343(+)
MNSGAPNMASGSATSPQAAENLDQDDEDFMKVHQILPDMHHLSTILKVYQIESVVVRDILSFSVSKQQLFKKQIYEYLAQLNKPATGNRNAALHK